MVVGSYKMAQTEKDTARETAIRQAENERNILDFIMVNNKTVEVAKDLDHLEYISTLGARKGTNKEGFTLAIWIKALGI